MLTSSKKQQYMISARQVITFTRTRTSRLRAYPYRTGVL